MAMTYGSIDKPKIITITLVGIDLDRFYQNGCEIHVSGIHQGYRHEIINEEEEEE